MSGFARIDIDDIDEMPEERVVSGRIYPRDECVKTIPKEKKEKKR